MDIKTKKKLQDFINLINYNLLQYGHINKICESQLLT